MLAALSVANRGYRIGAQYPGIYLSYTELQIVAGLLRNRHSCQIAADIGVSHRTVDYYCCNMMKLMGCKDLEDLIDNVRKSDLYQYIAC